MNAQNMQTRVAIRAHIGLVDRAENAIRSRGAKLVVLALVANTMVAQLLYNSAGHLLPLEACSPSSSNRLTAWGIWCCSIWTTWSRRPSRRAALDRWWPTTSRVCIRSTCHKRPDTADVESSVSLPRLRACYQPVTAAHSREIMLNYTPYDVSPCQILSGTQLGPVWVHESRICGEAQRPESHHQQEPEGEGDARAVPSRHRCIVASPYRARCMAADARKAQYYRVVLSHDTPIAAGRLAAPQFTSSPLVAGLVGMALGRPVGALRLRSLRGPGRLPTHSDPAAATMD
jgi:hypothetical protein